MKRLWIAFATVLILSFSVLGWIGTRIYQEMPPLPEHYVSEEAFAIISSYLEEAAAAHAQDAPLPDFPEHDLAPHLDNTWTDTAKAIFNNWLGLVYQLTNLDRRRPFMEGINPRRPLESLPTHAS